MSAINNLFEDAKYLISRMLGGKSREQMAEEERKAAEQKAKEEQLAAMERKKMESEAAEKRQKDLVQEITSALKSNEDVAYGYKAISNGSTNDDLFAGKGLSCQKFKLEIIVGDKFTAVVTVINDPESPRIKKLNDFLSWSYCKVLDPEITPKEFKDGLSKESHDAIVKEIMSCAQISTCIDYLKRTNTPSFLELYKDEWMSTFGLYCKPLGALRLTKSEDKYQIDIRGNKISFNEEIFEFRKSELAAALGLKDCKELSRSALLLFEKEINRLARHQHHLVSRSSKDELKKITEVYKSKTGTEILPYEISDGIYTLEIRRFAKSNEIINGCNEITLCEAIGAIHRRIEEFDSQNPKFTHAEIINKLEILRENASRQTTSDYYLNFRIEESVRPGTYELSISLPVVFHDKSKKMLHRNYEAASINDLASYIERQIQDPSEISDDFNKKIQMAYHENVHRPKIKHVRL